MAYAADVRDSHLVMSYLTGAVASNPRQENNTRSSKQPDLESVPSGKARLAGLLFGNTSGSQSRTARGKTASKQVRSPVLLLYLIFEEYIYDCSTISSRPPYS